MTDLEISKALALAIGWKRILPNQESPMHKQCWVLLNGSWRQFDYRDWNVIGPIAERYEKFPMYGGGNRTWSSDYWTTEADTPQKAIALAVIWRNA